METYAARLGGVAGASSAEGQTVFRLIRRHPIKLILLLAVGGGGVWLFLQSRKPKPLPVRVAQVEVVDRLTQIVTASGEIRAHEMVDIQTEVAGVIDELHVREGQDVHQGDILLQIDPFQAEMLRQGARARYESAQADIARAEALIAGAEAGLVRQREELRTAAARLEEARINLDREQRNLNRYKELLEIRAVARDQYELIETAFRIAQQQVESAEAFIEQVRAGIRVSELDIEQQKVVREASRQALSAAEAELNRASDQLAKTRIHSPLTGRIVRLNVDVGERAVPGIQSNPQATLMTIANLATIEAEIQVDETDIVNVEMGDPTQVFVDALPDRPLEGRVTEISVATVQPLGIGGGQEGRDFKVVIELLAPPPELRIGMSCESEITVATVAEPLAIPIQALTMREVPIDAEGQYAPPPKPDPHAGPGAPAAGSGSAHANDTPTTGVVKPKQERREMQGVFVREGDYARYRLVQTGIMGESRVEVLSGLERGEEVIIGPLSSLRQMNEWTLIKKEEEGPRPGS